MGNFYYNLVQFDAGGALNGLGFRIQLNDFTEATTADGGSMASMLVTFPFSQDLDNGDISIVANQYMVFNDPVIEVPTVEDVANGYDWADWKIIGDFPNGQKMMVFVTAEDGRDSHLHDASHIIFSSDYSQVLHVQDGFGNGYAGFGWFDDSARVIGTSEALNTEVENGSYTIPEGDPVVGKRIVVKLPSLVVDGFPTEAVANLYDGSGTLVASAINSATTGQPHLFVFGTAASPLPNVHATEGSDLVGHSIFLGDTYGDGMTDGGSAGLIEVYLRDESDVEVLAATTDLNAAAVSYLDTDANPGVYFNIDVVGEVVTLGTLSSDEADLSDSAPAAPSYRTRVHGPDQVDMKLVSSGGDEYKTMTQAKEAGLAFGSAISPMLELAYSAIGMAVSDYDGAADETPVHLAKLNAVADEVVDLLSADLAALQADVDQNEADSDAAHAAATTDRAAIRSEFAAADLALSGALTSTISALQADVDQNELDGDTDRAAIRSEFAAADTALETAMLAAIAAVQADVDGNEADGDTDRAAIRSEVEVIRAALQADVDQNEADADAAIAALQADVDQNEADADAAIAALQADVDQNEADSDAAHSAATTDRAAIRSEMAANETARDASVEAIRAALQADVDQNEADADAAIAAEEAARIAADNALTTSLNTEISDRISAVADEAAARLEGDQTLQSNIDALSSMVMAGVDWKAPVETVADMVTLLGDESGNFKSGDVRVIKSEMDAFLYVGTGGEDLTSLDASFGTKFIRFMDSSEILAGIQVVQTAVDNEVARAQLAEGQLDDAIGAETQRALGQEAAIRSEFAAADTALETSLQAAIDAVQADVDQNEADSDAAHSAATTDRAAIRSEMAANETARDASVEAIRAALQADVDQNEADADAAIAALQADVDQNEADADAAIAALQADVDQNEADADAAILAEETRALAAEAAIQADVDANEAAALQARTELSAAYQAADAALQAEMDQSQLSLGLEADGTYVADAAATYISGATSMKGADSLLDAAIVALQADVDQNEADADAAILAEETRALAAEAAIQADVDANEAAATAGLNAATVDRAAIRSEFAAADATLQSSIDALQADVDQNEADADAAIAALQADVDQNEADADAAIAALQADVDQNEADADAAIADLQSQVDFIVSNTDPAAIDSLTEMLAAFQAGDSDLLAAINALESKHDTEMAALQADVDQNEADSDAAHSAATTDRAAIRSEFAAADEALETAMLAAIAVVQADVDQNEADADAAIAAEETARLAGDAAAAADRAILRTDLLLLQDRDRTQSIALLSSDFDPGAVITLDEPASHVPFVFVNGVMIRPIDSANGIEGDYTLNSDANGNFESISFGIPLYQGDAIIIKYLKAVVLS